MPPLAGWRPEVGLYSPVSNKSGHGRAGHAARMLFGQYEDALEALGTERRANRNLSWHK
jgi:hypothetical protein